MAHVDVSHLRYVLPNGRVLLDDVSFRVGEGAKAALVGANGTGKTTLLRILAGELRADAGTAVSSGGVGVMPQFVGSISDATTVRDLLLLDEPDNYLDVPGKHWLERALRATPKTVLYISHDRELLARTATRVVTLEGGRAWTHGGGFATYDEARRARHQRLRAVLGQWEREHDRLRDLVRTLQQQAARSEDMAARYRATQTRLRRFVAAQTHDHPELVGRTLVDILWEDAAQQRGPAMAALRRYELAEAAQAPFEELSGGQQARFQILLLELSGTTLLLLDEPTDNLFVSLTLDSQRPREPDGAMPRTSSAPRRSSTGSPSSWAP